jgi:hypothetical protein
MKLSTLALATVMALTCTGAFAQSSSSGGSSAVGVRVAWIGFICFVTADHATCRRTQFSVSSRVAGHAADNGSLDTSPGVRSGRESERNRDCRRQNPSHVRSPIVKDRQANQSGRTLFRPRRSFLRQQIAQPPRALSAIHESDLADRPARPRPADGGNWDCRSRAPTNRP